MGFREFIINLLNTHVYSGLFMSLVLGIIGLPLPDELILAYCGYLTTQGKAGLILIWLVAVGGSIGGMSVSYLLGRLLGLTFLHKYGKYVGLVPAKLERAEKWIDKYAVLAIPIGYFVPGVRHLTAFIMASMELSYRKFILYAIPGAVMWTGIFLTSGILLEEEWRKIRAYIHHPLRIILVLAVFGVGYAIFNWSKKRSGTS